MGVVDRTDEFRGILQDLMAKGLAPVEDGDMLVPKEQSQMNAWSSEIGAQIHQVSVRVGELRKMAKKKDIFNDKTSEIQELTYSVKEDIQALDQKIEALERKVKGTGPNRASQAHTSSVVGALKGRLLEVMKELKDAVEDRSKAMDQQDKRRQMYSASQGVGANPFAQRQANRPTPTGNPDDPESGMAPQAQAQLYYNSRADAVQSVQRTIGELATMFQKMAVMVTAQEEMIQRIDADIDDTLENVNTGQDQLLKYFRNISSNRALILKVFLILLFFVIFFVVFLA